MGCLGATSESRLSTIGLSKPIVLNGTISIFNEVNITHFLSVYFVDIPDIPIISIDLLYKPDILNKYGVSPYYMGFIDIYGTYMVFIVIITVNPDI